MKSLNLLFVSSIASLLLACSPTVEDDAKTTATDTAGMSEESQLQAQSHSHPHSKLSNVADSSQSATPKLDASQTSISQVNTDQNPALDLDKNLDSDLKSKVSTGNTVNQDVVNQNTIKQDEVVSQKVAGDHYQSLKDTAGDSSNNNLQVELQQFVQAWDIISQEAMKQQAVVNQKMQQATSRADDDAVTRMTIDLLSKQKTALTAIPVTDSKLQAIRNKLVKSVNIAIDANQQMINIRQPTSEDEQKLVAKFTKSRQLSEEAKAELHGLMQAVP